MVWPLPRTEVKWGRQEMQYTMCMEGGFTPILRAKVAYHHMQFLEIPSARPNNASQSASYIGLEIELLVLFSG